jgi:hypothetical protein
LAFVQVVPAAERAAFEAELGRSIMDEPEGAPAPARSEYLVVKWVSPDVGDPARLVGWNLGADPVRRAAAERARDAGRPLLAMKRPQDGLPEDIRDHIRLMCDIIALAFQTDKTRVASLLLARDLSSLYYPFLSVREGHHGASHDDLSDGYERISRFHLSQLAYLAQKLDAMPEGEGTVLDNCCLMWLSNMWAGWKHDNMKVPVVTAGGLGGTLETGRSLDYLYAGDDNRKLCSLYLSLMDRMGVKLDSFGDATTRLASL